MANGDVVEMLPRSTAGRPPVYIDWEHVSELLSAGASVAAVAATIGIDRTRLYQRCLTDNNIDFTTFQQQRRAKGDAILNVAQFNNAVKNNNVTMQIWLGKQRLGQTDQQTIKIETDTTLLIQTAAQRLVLKGWSETEALEAARNYYTPQNA